MSSVGVAGFTLGGGLGWLSRRLGLAVDNLMGADVVTAEGELVRADSNEDPRLFWGLRGGSGNPGIVCRSECRLHRVGPEVLAGQAVYPLEEAGRLLRWYRDYMREAPDEIGAFPFFIRIPPLPDFPPDATAFPHRGLADGLHIFPGRNDPNEDEAVMVWAERLHQQLERFAGGGVYVNMPAEDEEDRIPSAFRGNYSRLRALKKKWDPENLFRSNPNIRPSE